MASLARGMPGSHNDPMAANPNPTHITEAMWWFIEEWERLEPATVYAGSWGDFKPGYHADWYTLKHHSGWQNDYSVQLADDQVPAPHPNEHMGAAVDITFPSAQSGNYTSIRKYSDRIRAAWKARDPRLKGWREVLCNSSDGDSGADGYDFVSWSERTPDDTHKWHIHFSCLRKFVNVLDVFKAMMSILRGETLAQWLAKGDEMPKAIYTTKGYWICQAGWRDPINDGDDMAKVTEVYGNICWPKADPAGFPTPQIDLPTAQGGKGWSWEEIDRILGRPRSSGDTGTGGGATADEVRVIVHDELGKLKMSSDVE